MEALAAVSLAGNILQFLTFTGDEISKSRQIRTSSSGILKEHHDLECLTTDLKGLSCRLQASVGLVTQSWSSYIQAATRSQTSCSWL